MDEQLKKHGLHIGDDDRVCWNDDNKEHPRNWSLFAKTYNNANIIWLEFFMTAVSTAGVRYPSMARLDSTHDLNRLRQQTQLEQNMGSARL